MATYIDDVRTTGSLATHCWKVSHRVSTQLCYLGIQDAFRKRTAPIQRAGAWTGSLTQTPPEAIIVSCMQEKWSWASWYVEQMQDQLNKGLLFKHKNLK